MKKDIDFLKMEEQGMNERLAPKEREDLPVFDKLLKRFDVFSEQLKNYKPLINKVVFPHEMVVKGSVSIKEAVEAIVKFPAIQKITGRVTADVTFPEVQKVAGTVKAEVDFPKEFEVTVKNQLDELDLQPLMNLIEKQKLPVGYGKANNPKENNPREYIPVRLTNGEDFINELGGGGGSVSGTGAVVSVLKQILMKPDPAISIPAGGSTSANQDTMITSLQLLDDAIYTESATDASITGVAVMMEGAANTLLPIQGTVADGLLVNLGANNDVTVTGSVTANAGTNLNTSLLALETGGNLAAIATSLGNIDNSVDGNYLNVNANIAGVDMVSGSGTATGALRVELPTNGTGVIATVGAVTSITNAVTVNSHAVTNAGTFAVQVDGAALTALQLIDDPVVVLGTATYTEASSKGNIMAAVRRDADTTLVDTTNEFAPLIVDARGFLKVEAFSGETLPVSDASGSLTVDAPIGTPVNVQIGNATLAAGVIDETGASAVDALAIGGGTAHDAVDSGNPIKVGGRAVDLGATPTAVAAADRTHAIFMRNGIPFVLGGHPNTTTQSLQVTDADGAQTDVAIVTVSAGTAIVVTKVSVMADNANTVDVSCRIGFGTANTPAADAAGIVLFHPGIAAGSGVVEGDGGGIIGIGASNEDLRVTCEDPVSGSINIIVTYFTVLIG